MAPQCRYHFTVLRHIRTGRCNQLVYIVQKFCYHSSFSHAAHFFLSKLVHCMSCTNCNCHLQCSFNLFKSLYFQTKKALLIIYLGSFCYFPLLLEIPSSLLSTILTSPSHECHFGNTSKEIVNMTFMLLCFNQHWELGIFITSRLSVP